MFRELIGIVGRKAHLEKGDERAVKIGFPFAAIDQNRDSSNLSTIRFDDIHCLLSPPATSNDILNDEDGLVWLDFETSPEYKAVVLLLHENVTGVKLPSDLLPYH